MNIARLVKASIYVYIHGKQTFSLVKAFLSIEASGLFPRVLFKNGGHIFRLCSIEFASSNQIIYECHKMIKPFVTPAFHFVIKLRLTKERGIEGMS